jgi:hypothetical protein
MPLRRHPDPHVFRAVHELGSASANTGKQRNGIPLDQRHVPEIQHHLHPALSVDKGPEICGAGNVDGPAHREGDGVAIDEAFNAAGHRMFATKRFQRNRRAGPKGGQFPQTADGVANFSRPTANRLRPAVAKAGVQRKGNPADTCGGRELPARVWLQVGLAPTWKRRLSI